METLENKWKFIYPHFGRQLKNMGMTKDKIIELFKQLIEAGGSKKIDTRHNTSIQDILHLQNVGLVYHDKSVQNFGDMAFVRITDKGREWLEKNIE